MHPKNINYLIVKYSDWRQTPDTLARQELLGLWKDYRNQFSDVNLATFVSRGAYRKLFHADEPVVAQLAARAQQLMGRSDNPRAIASVAAGFAKIGHRDAKTWAVICAAATQCMADFSARELGQLMHAVGHRGRDPGLLRAAAIAVARCAGSLDGQPLCSVAWFCARMMPAAELGNIGQRLSRAAQACADQLSVQQIGYLLKSFGLIHQRTSDGEAGGRPAEIDWEPWVGRLREGLDRMSNKEVALALAGMLCMPAERRDPELIDRIAERVAREAAGRCLRQDEIAQLTVNFAKVAEEREGREGRDAFGALMSALAGCARDGIAGFTPRGIVDIARAHAKSKQFDFDRELFNALCAKALADVEAFDAAQLAGLHWACSERLYRDADWLRGISAALQRQAGAGQLSKPWCIATLVSSMAKLWHDDRHLLEALAAAAKGCLDDFNDQEISNVAWGLAALGHPDDELAGRLSAAANAKWRDFHEFGLVQLHQAALAWPLRLDGALRGRVDEGLQRMRDGAPDANVFESQLSEALSRLDIDHEMQGFEEGYFMDCGCEVDGVRVDVECDGERFHYFVDRDGRRDGLVGGNRLRDRILESRGYAVLRVRSTEWQELPDLEQRARWLRGRLDETAQHALATRRSAVL